MSGKLSESMNAGVDAVTTTDDVLDKTSDKYKSLYNELKRVLVAYSTPKMKFFGVYEIYELNYILNTYGLMFKRSLYRLFITVAIMDSIGTRLGNEVSYIEHLTDIVVDMFGIPITGPDSDECE